MSRPWKVGDVVGMQNPGGGPFVEVQVSEVWTCRDIPMCCGTWSTIAMSQPLTRAIPASGWLSVERRAVGCWLRCVRVSSSAIEPCR